MYFVVRMTVDAEARSAAWSKFQSLYDADIGKVPAKILGGTATPDLTTAVVLMDVKSTEEMEQLLTPWRQFGSIKVESVETRIAATERIDEEVRMMPAHVSLFVAVTEARDIKTG